MKLSGYKRLLEARRRELPTRVVIACVIGVTAYMFHPTLWPLIWLGAVVASQAVDYALTFSIWGRPRATKLWRVALYNANLVVTSAIYSAIALYFWRYGDAQAQVYGATVALGSMLHSTLHMRTVRLALLCATVPHGLWYFMLALDAGQGLTLGPGLLLISSGLLYMSHLAYSVVSSSRMERALTSALRAAMEERARAEHASLAKSEFLAVMSHEIRTPMNAVVSSAHLLERDSLSAEQRRHVDALRGASDAMLGLLDDLLDFSKIEAGKMRLDLTPTDLAEKLGDVATVWRGRIEEKGLALRVEIAADLPNRLILDPQRVRQVLFNLLSNAVKFTDRGEIGLRAGWDAKDQLVRLEVRDTGCGIAPNRLDSVFHSFEQAETGTSRRYGGSGLGLSISRKLAQIMGGELSASSAPGSGSTFTLAFPAEPVETDADASADAPAVRDLRGARILAADDNDVNRMVLQAILESTGCALTLVEEGAQAVEAARREVFDVIVLDMQMPVMDGHAAARAIRSAGANKATPIMALTANALDSHRAAWAEIGVGEFMTKPVEPERLISTLARLSAAREEAAA